MKRKLGKLFLFAVITVLMAMGMALVSSAEYWDYCGDDVIFTYNESTGEVVISGSGPMWDYGYDYDSEEYYSSPFAVEPGDDMNVKKVTVKNGVTSIGTEAFYGCSTLESISVPASVTYISTDAFIECDSLKKITVNSSNSYYSSDAYGVLYNKNKTYLIQYPVGNAATTYTIPASVNEVEYLAFNRCRNLTAIKVSASNKDYVSDSYGVLYDKDMSLLIQYPVGNKRTSYTIPYGVDDIEGWSFEACQYIKNITVPESVCSVYNGAFCGCSALENITLPYYMDYIGESAFAGCSSLKSIDLSRGIEEIEAYTFDGCSNLRKIIIPGTVYYFDDGCFNYCSRLSEICFEGSWDEWYDIESSDIGEWPENADVYIVPDVEYYPATTNVDLYWDEIEDATGYAIYMKVSGSWKLIRTTYYTDYTVENLCPDTNYIFAVRAYERVGSKTYMADRFTTVNVRTNKLITENLKARSYTDSIVLSWDYAENAWGYRVFLKTASGWKALKTTNVANYTVTGLKPSTNYTFAVRAYVKVNGKVIWASKYPVITTSTALSAVSLRVASNVKSTATIVWGRAEGVTGYQVWYTTDYMNSYRKLGNYNGNYTYHRSLCSGDTYYYRVRPYKAVGGSYVYGPWSPVASVTAK